MPPPQVRDGAQLLRTCARRKCKFETTHNNDKEVDRPVRLQSATRDQIAQLLPRLPLAALIHQPVPFDVILLVEIEQECITKNEGRCDSC